MKPLFRLELKRMSRNRRTLFFSAFLPVLFFLSFSAGGDQKDTLNGLTVAPYVMVSMSTYAAMNALLSTGALIALERSTGWVRQLRVAGLAGRDYLITKTGIAYLTALPGLLVIFVIAHTAKHVDLPWDRWIFAAVSILAGLLPVAVLGIFIGYSVSPTALQPLIGIGSALLALFGGVFVPAENFPDWLQDIIKELPSYWSARAGRQVLIGDWVGVRGLVVLLAWTVVLGLLAARAYRRDSSRPGYA